jgi:hypothetical protein
MEVKMERCFSTDNNKIVFNAINLGYKPVIRDSINGRFVAWDVAKKDNFGFNGRHPITYNHLDDTFSMLVKNRYSNPVSMNWKYNFYFKKVPYVFELYK